VAERDDLVRRLELRRHTDNDGDMLTDDGIRAAEAIGARLRSPYALFASTGAARATQMAQILRRSAGQDDLPITIADGLRSSVEDRWRDAAGVAGKGADLERIRQVDRELVDNESRLLGKALRELLDQVPEGGTGLFVGHSPTTEAAIFGLTGQMVEPLAKGAGVLLAETNGTFQLQQLD
jgi:phosphohistidine phosphatase SixA